MTDTSQFQNTARQAVAMDVDYDDSYDEFADDLEPEGPRLGRWSKVLLTLLLVAVAFTGGILTHKQFGVVPVAAPTAFTRQPGSMPTGVTPTGAAPTGAAGTTTGTTTAPTTPVLVGSVTEIGENSLRVTDLGGNALRVTTSATTTVTDVIAGTGLESGKNVRIFGTKNADGSVTATSIVIR